jgi:hypothetical protein
MIEPIFAQTKVTRRADRFQRRGFAACRSAWRLIAATHNLLKLHRHPAAAGQGGRPPGRTASTLFTLSVVTSRIVYFVPPLRDSLVS